MIHKREIARIFMGFTSNIEFYCPGVSAKKQLSLFFKSAHKCITHGLCNGYI